jgi:hypothetical protein
VLLRLHDEVPASHFTLGWLLHSPRKRSIGVIMLLLALVAITPGLSIVAGLLLMNSRVSDETVPAFHATSPLVPCRRGTSLLWCSDPYRCSDILRR